MNYLNAQKIVREVLHELEQQTGQGLNLTGYGREK